ncbi:ABC transporter permease [Kineococcus indalonis]|uniref:ABC transporter permease n=1 Tax=Kineococcus indalonis TaxID=2696566 RepID=UPI001411E237|nr:ABC transporter permease [Kineococcus indalonis]NAZ86420.1 ABC transporter permease [Kineococcus indalonis]
MSAALPVGRVQRSASLVAHLTAREFRVRYQSAFLGWLWALAPVLARFTVLGVVFTALLPGRGPDYLAELAVGVLAWTWFSGGVLNATTSAVDRADLLTQPALPRQVVPVVSVLTDAFDYLAGLPVLLLVVALDTGGVPLSALLFPLLLVLQGCLTVGLGMAASVGDVHLRDTRLGVGLVLSVGIYVTPVFYSVDTVPAALAEVVRWNPVGALIEAQRQVLVAGTVPGAGSLAALAAVCLGVLAGGWALHRRFAPTFLDHL